MQHSFYYCDLAFSMRVQVTLNLNILLKILQVA